VAIALSGGLDSSIVALLARDRVDRDLLTFTVNASSSDEDAVAARAVASGIGSTHREVRFDFESYVRAIPQFIRDRESVALGGLTLHLLAGQVSPVSGCCLTGIGAGDAMGDGADDLRWPLFQSQVQRKLRRAEAVGIPVSDEAHDVLDAVMAARSHGEYEDGPGYTFQGIDWVDRCGSSHCVAMRSPFGSEELYQFVRAVAPSVREQVDTSPKRLLRLAALRRFGDEARGPALRAKRAMPDATVAHYRRFVERCGAAGIADTHEREFSRWIHEPHLLLLIDLFSAMFERRVDPDALDIFDRLDAAADRIPA
jgi:asparagine synthetase B (glutamine-hydrolysing)